MNLIENAAKYAETKGSSGGKVDVKAHTREGYDVSAYVRSKPGQGVSLKQPISRYSSVDLEDVYNVKKALMSEGYYEPNPKLGLNEFTDEALFDGIQRFQKDNGLRVDGIMKPGGETEKKINEVKNKIINKFDYYKNKYKNINEDDCSFLGVGKKAVNIAIKSNARNPIKTENKVLDTGANKIPVIKNWNKGWNIGKGVFIAKQIYEDACKNK